MSDTGRRLIIGTRKGLFVFAREPSGWTRVRFDFAGIPVSYACVDARHDVLWACLDHGHWGQKLHRSRDGGATWEELTPPEYPEGAEVTEGEPATLRYLWVLEPGRAGDGERVLIGTDPGGLFRSGADGTRFDLVEGLWEHPSRATSWFGGGRDRPGIHSIVLDPRDRERMLVGVSCAGVFETTDGGESWSPRNRGLIAEFLPDPNAEVGHDPHYLVACASSPDVLWQQNHCGIFRSADGAATWAKVSEEGGPAHFGFAVAVDPNDGATAWVVPAVKDECRIAVDGALCVSRTEDAGRTWTALREGLPQEDCYDIVLRHALDVSGDGRRLAFGSTTGNVFVSENRGDSWQCLGRHLPPVYSVRFAR